MKCEYLSKENNEDICTHPDSIPKNRFLFENECEECEYGLKKIREKHNPILFPMLSYKTDIYQVIKDYIKEHPVHYDNGRSWWIWDRTDCCWKRIDETDILISINKAVQTPNVNSTIKNEILEAFKQHGRMNKLKKARKTWIQFKNTIYDIETDKTFKATPEYFITNPIPWKMGNSEETPTIDKLFKDWVGEKYVQTLFEIIAYCMLPSYPIHRLFCFYGSGMNGKSCFLRLLKRFIGMNNITSTELDVLLNSRFEITRLHKKLVCIMGETNFTEINKTSILKKLTGQDLIGFEYKNKDPFEDMNYAKILIATNNLPATTDKTIGFYRRWCIIDFPNTFQDERNILKDIPRLEYNNLALKSIKILKNLLKITKFNMEGTIEERMQKYEEKSNPFDKFWKDNIDEDPNGNIYKFELKNRLKDWCQDNKFRIMSDVTISQRMKEKNIETGKTRAVECVDEERYYWSWLGIKWKTSRVSRVSTLTPLQTIYIGAK